MVDRGLAMGAGHAGRVRRRRPQPDATPGAGARARSTRLPPRSAVARGLHYNPDGRRDPFVSLLVAGYRARCPA